MDNAPRKASEIILSLEQKIDQLVKANNSLDLNVKILSNRLNKVMEILQTVNVAPNPPASSISVPMPPTTAPQAVAPSFSVSAPEQPPAFVDYQKDNQIQPVMVQKEETLPVSDDAVGYRRSGRPDAANVKQTTPSIITAPKASAVEVPATLPMTQEIGGSKVVVQQRVVDANHKAIFLADVEITNASTRQLAFKGRTTGVGKWTASLSPGTYEVVLRRHESTTKRKMEQNQTLVVDGAQQQLDLPPVIMEVKQ